MVGIQAVRPERPLIIMHPSSTVPDGYLECNGAAISRSAYAWLFGKISTTYGVGDGSTTFNIPDFRGHFPRGWDNGRGVDTGRAIGSTQADDIKSHTHGLNTGQGAGGSGYPNEFQTLYQSGVSGRVTATGGTETRPKNIAQMFCIATKP